MFELKMWGVKVKSWQKNTKVKYRHMVMNKVFLLRYLPPVSK